MTTAPQTPVEWVSALGQQCLSPPQQERLDLHLAAVQEYLDLFCASRDEDEARIWFGQLMTALEGVVWFVGSVAPGRDQETRRLEHVARSAGDEGPGRRRWGGRAWEFAGSVLDSTLTRTRSAWDRFKEYARDIYKSNMSPIQDPEDVEASLTTVQRGRIQAQKRTQEALYHVIAQVEEARSERYMLNREVRRLTQAKLEATSIDALDEAGAELRIICGQFEINANHIRALNQEKRRLRRQIRDTSPLDPFGVRMNLQTDKSSDVADEECKADARVTLQEQQEAVRSCVAFMQPAAAGVPLLATLQACVQEMQGTSQQNATLQRLQLMAASTFERDTRHELATVGSASAEGMFRVLTSNVKLATMEFLWPLVQALATQAALHAPRAAAEHYRSVQQPQPAERLTRCGALRLRLVSFLLRRNWDLLDGLLWTSQIYVGWSTEETMEVRALTVAMMGALYVAQRRQFMSEQTRAFLPVLAMLANRYSRSFAAGCKAVEALYRHLSRTTAGPPRRQQQQLPAASQHGDRVAIIVDYKYAAAPDPDWPHVYRMSVFDALPPGINTLRTHDWRGGEFSNLGIAVSPDYRMVPLLRPGDTLFAPPIVIVMSNDYKDAAPVGSKARFQMASPTMSEHLRFWVPHSTAMVVVKHLNLNACLVGNVKTNGAEKFLQQQYGSLRSLAQTMRLHFNCLLVTVWRDES